MAKFRRSADRFCGVSASFAKPSLPAVDSVIVSSRINAGIWLHAILGSSPSVHPQLGLGRSAQARRVIHDALVRFQAYRERVRGRRLSPFG